MKWGGRKVGGVALGAQGINVLAEDNLKAGAVEASVQTAAPRE
jgi:hypothetical protein